MKLSSASIDTGGSEIQLGEICSEVEIRCTNYSNASARMAISINGPVSSATVGDGRVLFIEGEIFVFRGSISSIGARMNSGTGTLSVTGGNTAGIRDQVGADY